MPFKTNYRHERAQRTRAKESKQQEKLLRRKEASDKRKALREGETGTGPDAATDDSPEPRGG